MSVQAPMVPSKQQHQINPIGLSASYTEGITNDRMPTSRTPRDVYIYRGLDKNLLMPNLTTSRLTSTSNTTNNNNKLNRDLLQRYKQSMVPSKPAYRSAVTIDEALNPPWALHYNMKRAAATPNFQSKSTNILIPKDPPRRLMSAPLVRSSSPAAILNIPEPCLENITVPSTTKDPSLLKSRSTSADVPINSLNSSSNKQKGRETKSAHIPCPKDDSNLTNETTKVPLERPVQIIFTKTNSSSIPPPPVFIYKKSSTWCPDEGTLSPFRIPSETRVTPPNPHYVHRPAVIVVDNVEKKALEKESSRSKRTRHQRRERSTHDKRNHPLLAVAPISQNTKLSLETEGVKLTYDPKLTLDDKSPNLSKYFIDGRLYLIKDHRYNVLNNVDPSILQKYTQNATLSPRPKYYQTVPIEKLQLPKPTSEVHYNASDTFFFNTIPKRSHRYVINPNFISENLNVNRLSLGERPPTTTIYA